MEIFSRLTPDQIKAYNLLSPQNEHFFNYVESHPEFNNPANFQKLSYSHGAFTPWPIFVSEHMNKQFGEMASTIARILQDVPYDILKGDLSLIQEYFELSEEDSKSVLNSNFPRALKTIIMRGDYLLTPDGFKCIEVNVTAGLGGWECPIVKKILTNDPLIKDYLDESDISVKNKDIMFDLFCYVIDILRKDKNLKEFNVAFVSEGDLLKNMDNIIQHFAEIYKAALNHKGFDSNSGKLLSLKYDDLKVYGNKLYHEGDIINMLLVLLTDVPAYITEVVLKNNLQILNGNIYNLLSNKLLFAYLSEAAEKNEVPQWSDTIKKLIPWTRKLRSIPATFHNNHANLIDIVKRNKDHIVLKQSLNYAGNGIFLGNNYTDADWSDLIDKAVTQKNWVVQEKLDVIPLVNLIQPNECTEFDSVWGLFTFGNQFRGSYLRVLAKDRSKGIVNLGQGAGTTSIFDI